MSHTRKRGEDIISYMVRICSNMDEYDLTWDDVSNLVSKQTGSISSSEKLQQWWKVWQSCMDWMKEKDDSSLEDIEFAKRELYKERVRIQDQRREWNKIHRDDARLQFIKDELVNAVFDMANQRPLEIKAPSRTLLEDMDEDREGALLLSDWHTGLFAKNYWNNFGVDEFYRRVERLTEKSIQYSLLNGVHILHLFSLGDLVNGLIHVTTRILSTEDVIAQTMRVADTLAQVIAKYASVFPLVMLYFVRGNHDRVTPNKNDEIADESFSDVVQWYLKARLSDAENVIFMDNEYDSEIANAEICGNTVYAVHGHRDKVENVVQNLSLMTKKVPDYVLMGHIHHMVEKDVQGVEVIVNSSLSGVDSYAKEVRKIGKPAQKLLIFDKFEGRLATYNIVLSNA